MTKITKEVLYTELSIKIAILEAKIDKLLELATKPAYTPNPDFADLSEHVSDFNNNPPQWPNESYIDYMKRIGQYNEASSLDEKFLVNYK